MTINDWEEIRGQVRERARQAGQQTMTVAIIKCPHAQRDLIEAADFLDQSAG